MADAKIITFGELFSATTDVIPDNKAAAVEIEGLDGNDYIKINTTDGEESVRLVSSGTGNAGVGAWTEDYSGGPPMYPFAIHGTGAEADGDILEIRSTGTLRNGGVAIRSDDGDPRIRFQAAASSKWAIGFDKDDNYTFKIDQDNAIGADTKLEIDTAGNVSLAAGLNVANTGAIGTNSVAIGEIQVSASGARAIALGNGRADPVMLHRASGEQSVAIGTECNATATSSVAIGRLNTASNYSSVAIGPGGNTASGHSSAVFGTGASVAGERASMALGYSSRSTMPYEQSFGGSYYATKQSAALSKYACFQVETTDDSATVMQTAAESDDVDMVVNTTNSSATDKSSTSFFRVRVISSVTGGSEDTDFEIGEFLCREYNLAIKWFYSTGASTIELISDAAGTAIGSGATIYAARENVRASNSLISHATNGIVDSIVLTTANSAERGSWSLKVASANANATIRHTCYVDQVDHILA